MIVADFVSEDAKTLAWLARVGGYSIDACAAVVDSLNFRATPWTRVMRKSMSWDRALHLIADPLAALGPSPGEVRSYELLFDAIAPVSIGGAGTVLTLQYLWGNSKELSGVWTARNLGTAPASPTLDMQDIKWCGSQFVACGAGTGSRIMTSADGITWVDALISNDGWHSIAYDPATNTTLVLGTSMVAISTDGITFTPHATTVSGVVVWADTLGKWVEVHTDGAATSTDGITWVAAVSVPSGQWSSFGTNTLAWSHELGMLAAVARNGGGKIMSSTDGSTWVLRTNPYATSWSCITWAKGLGLFVGLAEGYGELTSADGVNWSATSLQANNWQAITWVEEASKLVAVATTGLGSGPDRVGISADGTNWSAETAAENNTFWGVAYSSSLGRLAAVARSGTHRIMTSDLGSLTATMAYDVDAATVTTTFHGEVITTPVPPFDRKVMHLMVQLDGGPAAFTVSVNGATVAHNVHSTSTPARSVASNGHVGMKLDGAGVAMLELLVHDRTFTPSELTLRRAVPFNAIV